MTRRIALGLDTVAYFGHKSVYYARKRARVELLRKRVKKIGLRQKEKSEIWAELRELNKELAHYDLIQGRMKKRRILRVMSQRGPAKTRDGLYKLVAEKKNLRRKLYGLHKGTYSILERAVMLNKLKLVNVRIRATMGTKWFKKIVDLPLYIRELLPL